MCNLKLCHRLTNATNVISCSPHFISTEHTYFVFSVYLSIYSLSLSLCRSCVPLRFVVRTCFFIAIIHFIAMSFYFVTFNSISSYWFFFCIVSGCCNVPTSFYDDDDDDDDDDNDDDDCLESHNHTYYIHSLIHSFLYFFFLQSQCSTLIIIKS